MARESTKALVLYLSRLPLLPEALSYAGMGLVPGGTHSNRSFYEPWVIYETQPGPELRDILYDPQTSGGLFITIADDGLDGLLAALHDRGVAGVVIGEVLDEPAGRIIIRE
jgi:selenide,water dikinase